MNTIEENKKLCERYPYLIPRNVWTDKIPDDYDYSYTSGDCGFPNGWRKLFMQMCEDIRQLLIDANYLDEFRFSQIKEKYGTMRCYHFGAPQEVHRIITKYEYISRYVCCECGKPATYETEGYIYPYCDDCWKDKVRHEKGHFIEFNPIMRLECYSSDKGNYIEETDCSDIWERLYE